MFVIIGILFNMIVVLIINTSNSPLFMYLYTMAGILTLLFASISLKIKGKTKELKSFFIIGVFLFWPTFWIISGGVYLNRDK